MRRLAASIVGAMLAATGTSAQAQFYALGVFDNDDESAARGVSPNGVVVGWSETATFDRAFTWTASTGMQRLEPVTGYTGSWAYAVNAAGDVVVGSSKTGNFTTYTATRWVSGVASSLGTLSGLSTAYSEAYGVNAAGDVVVGRSYNDTGNAKSQAFRWVGGTMSGLGFLNGGDASFARAVNAAGDVVVGYATDGSQGNNNRAFRWTSSTPSLQSLGTLGGNTSYAYGVNASGDVVVGYSPDAGGTETAFRWTSGAMASLGLLNGGTRSRAYAVNAMGDVVVGSARDGLAGNVSRAFRWQGGVMQSIEQWLANAGVAVDPSAAKTDVAYGVSADGSIVVGQLDDDSAFVARVSSVGSGMIDSAQFMQTLASAAPLALVPLTLSDLVMHGAHGSPLLGWLGSRQWSFSATGDVGVDRRGDTDVTAGVAEVRWSRRLGDGMQLQIALGHTAGRGRLLQQGRASASGTYVLPELMWKIGGGPLFFTASGYYNDGDVDARRGYLNAGAQDFSTGRADATTREWRLRLDWQDAATVRGAGLTPYVSYTHSTSSLGAYTESGGGFPVQWDARRETSRIVRAGVDGVLPLASPSSRLLGRLEMAQRVGDTSVGNASGTILGLGGFSLPGQPQRRSWLRAGLGGEMAAGAGVLSGMLHATSSGGWPAAAWLSVNYRVAF
ncbi:MAG: autotransporter domain-containing protein [Burkholderiaceae bacterium]|nr:autotransporter domain-containing protein [Burkholderiaceae bacterium]